VRGGISGDARSHRGFVLLAVLVVVAAAILVATGAIFTARATTSVARASAADARLREAALDGVSIATDRIARQRLSILRGDAPEIEETLLVRGDGLGSIEVSLAPLSGGALVESEAAKLDLNRTEPATLAALAAELGSDATEIVDAVIRARPVASLDGAVESLPEPMRLRALRTLLGPLRTLETSRGADDPPEASLVAAIGVHAREALVDNAGVPRLDVVAAFGGIEGGAFPAAAMASFDDGEVAAFRDVVASPGDSGAMQGGATPDDGRLAAALLARGVAIERVASILGQCTLHQGALAPARLDVLRADERVLAAFDGFGREAAARIVELRTTLDADERASTAWLVSRRVLAADAYARIAGRLTHRSTSWRFRVVARHAPAEAAGDGSVEAGASGPVAAFDCIVDVAAEPPRLVFLRDVSMLPTARTLALSLVERSAREGPSTEGFDGEGDLADLETQDVSATDRFTTVEVPEPTAPRMDSPRGSATMEPARAAPVRPRTDPTGRDVGGG